MDFYFSITFTDVANFQVQFRITAIQDPKGKGELLDFWNRGANVKQFSQTPK